MEFISWDNKYLPNIYKKAHNYEDLYQNFIKVTLIQKEKKEACKICYEYNPDINFIYEYT